MEGFNRLSLFRFHHTVPAMALMCWLLSSVGLLSTSLSSSVAAADSDSSFLSHSGIFSDDYAMQQTILLDRLPGTHRRALKQEILHLLGLHRRPRPSKHGKHDSAPTYMLDLYKVLRDEHGEFSEAVREEIFRRNLTLRGMEDSIDHSDMIMSLINHVGKAHWLRHEKRRSFYFEFHDVPAEQSVIGAELRLYKKVSKTTSPVTIEIFQIKPGPSVDERVLERETKTTVEPDYEGWVDLNVTSAVSQWNYLPATNLGLYMKITDNAGEELQPSDAGIVGRKGPDDKQAFMVVFFKATQEVKLRRTRSARKIQQEEMSYSDEPAWGYRRERYNHRVCQIRQLYVQFKDLNWQAWIIAPDGYSAFYCQGDCSFPLNVHMNATNHAIVQTLVHMMNPLEVPQPSCAPTKLSAISVLYFDDNSNVILKKYRNMVVKACGCH